MKLEPNPNDVRPLRAFEAASGLVYDKSKAAEQLPAFMHWYFHENRFSALDWSSHVQKAVELNLTRVSFEDLKSDPHDTLEPAFERMSSEKIDRARLADVIDQMAFDKVKSPESSHHKRKSQVGEWRTLFTRDARETFAEYAQEGLELMGYESDSTWIEIDQRAFEGSLV